MPPQLREVAIEHANSSWMVHREDYGCSFNPLLCSKRKVQRRVTISENLQVKEIPNRQQMARESIRDMYLSRKEISSLHAECWEIVDMLNLGLECSDRHTYSTRGLVELQDSALQRRKEIREKAYRVVFAMQSYIAKKKNLGCNMDPSAVMADLYSKSAAQAKKDAYMSGIRDAIAAGMVASL